MEVFRRWWWNGGLYCENLFLNTNPLVEFVISNPQLINRNSETYLQQMRRPRQQCKDWAPLVNQESWGRCDEPQWPALAWSISGSNQTTEHLRPFCHLCGFEVRLQTVQIQFHHETKVLVWKKKNCFSGMQKSVWKITSIIFSTISLSMFANATSCPRTFTYREPRGWREGLALHSVSCDTKRVIG